MPDALARILVAIVELYAGAGILFALAFVTVGVGRVDDHAREAGWGFRLLILPGSALFWPLLAARWLGRRAS
jgi:hypothetical protein